MPATAVSTASSSAAATPLRKTPTAPEKKYKCQFCNRAFSRSEHRSRHERSRKFEPRHLSRLFFFLVYWCEVGRLFGGGFFFPLVFPSRWWGRGQNNPLPSPIHTHKHIPSTLWQKTYPNHHLRLSLSLPFPLYFSPFFLVRYLSSIRSHRSIPHKRLTPGNHRHQRATVQVCQVSQHLCPTRPLAPT